MKLETVERHLIGLDPGSDIFSYSGLDQVCSVPLLPHENWGTDKTYLRELLY